MKLEQGLIEWVEVDSAESSTTGDASAGDTTLEVEDGTVFADGSGAGKLRVNGAVIGYDSVDVSDDDDAPAVIQLSSTLPADVDDGTTVALHPRSSVTYAGISVPGAAVGDVVTVRVPATARPLLALGPRDPDERELAWFFTSDGRNILFDWDGDIPVIQSDSLPAAGPPIAVGETRMIPLESPDGYGIYETNPNFYAAYLGHSEDVGEIKTLVGADGDLDPAFQAWVTSKIRWEPTGNENEYELHYRFLDTSDPDVPGYCQTSPVYEITDLLEVGGVYGFVGQVSINNLWGHSRISFDAYSGPSNSSDNEGDGFWRTPSSGYTLGDWRDPEVGYGADDPDPNYGNFTYAGGRYGFSMADTTTAGFLFDTDPGDGVLVDASGEQLVRGFGIKRIA